MSDCTNGEKPMNDWLFKALPYFIAGVFIATIIVYVSACIYMFKGIDYISNHGVKSVVNRVWNGENQ